MNNTLDLTVQPLLYTYPEGAAPPPGCISPRFGRAGQRGVMLQEIFFLRAGSTKGKLTSYEGHMTYIGGLTDARANSWVT